MNKKLMNKLRGLAKKEIFSDDEEFIAYEFFGGNFDDAYYGGFQDGQVSLAKEILEELE